MIRVAILISGEYRTFGVCRKTMTFLDDPTVDVYFSTWDTSHVHNDKLNLSVKENITQQKVEDTLGRNAKIVIEDSNQVNGKYSTKMIHRWVAGFDLIKASGIDYDYVYILRPDIFFDVKNPIPKFKKVLERTTRTHLYSAWNPHRDDIKKLADVQLITTPDNFSKIINSETSKLWNDSPEGDWHKWWYDHVDAAGIQVGNMFNELRHFVLCRYSHTDEPSYAEMIKNFAIWRNLTILNQIDVYGETAVLRWWTEKDIAEARAQAHFEKFKKDE